MTLQDLMAFYDLRNDVVGWLDQKACEEVLSGFEKLLSEGHLEQVDEILEDANVGRLTAPILLAILSITYHGKKHLKRRAEFREWVGASLEGRLGVERAHKLMHYR